MISRLIFLEWKMFQTNIVEAIKKHITKPENVPFIAVTWLAQLMGGEILYRFISNVEKQGINT
jgi:hypothetical protein